MTEEILAALRRRSVELAALHPRDSHDDLARWGAALDGVRVVGLGKATHGSREFFTLKHRLIEYLVTEQAFTVLALEANQDRCRALDAYVTSGVGDAAQGLCELGYWTCATQEGAGPAELAARLQRHGTGRAHGPRRRGRSVRPCAGSAGLRSSQSGCRRNARLSAYWGVIGYGDQLVDLRGALQDADLSGWAGRRQRMQCVGSLHCPAAWSSSPVVPAQDFDGIALVRSTTRARPSAPDPDPIHRWSTSSGGRGRK